MCVANRTVGKYRGNLEMFCNQPEVGLNKIKHLKNKKKKMAKIRNGNETSCRLVSEVRWYVQLCERNISQNKTNNNPDSSKRLDPVEMIPISTFSG
jgi:hypothetical protein